MKFIFGVIVGSAVGPRLYRMVDKKYGHVIIPFLKGVLARIENWEPPKESKT
jgi:hypothetical protein